MSLTSKEPTATKQSRKPREWAPWWHLHCQREVRSGQGQEPPSSRRPALILKLGYLAVPRPLCGLRASTVLPAPTPACTPLQPALLPFLLAGHTTLEPLHPEKLPGKDGGCCWPTALVVCSPIAGSASREGSQGGTRNCVEGIPQVSQDAGSLGFQGHEPLLACRGRASSTPYVHQPLRW